MPECTTCAYAPYASKDEHRCRTCFDYTLLGRPVYTHWAREVSTNADRIRSMSDEELAAWTLRLVDCDKENMMCNPAEYKHSGKCDGRCLQGRIDWLRQPEEEGQDNA